MSAGIDDHRAPRPSSPRAPPRAARSVYGLSPNERWRDDADPRALRARRDRGTGCSRRRPCRRWPAVAASRGSTPASAPRRTAASATVRAMGPAVSWLWAMGMMPARLTRPTVGLMPTTPQMRGGRDDRAVGLGADGGGAEVGGDGRGAEPELEPRGVAVERVGVAALAAAAAPAAGRVGGAEVRPLARGWSCRGARRRPRAAARRRRRRAAAIEPTSASEPAVVVMRSAVSMLSLSRIGDAVQRPARPLRLALVVERVGDRQRVGVDLDHARSAGPCGRGLDARQVGLDQRARRAAARAASPPAARRWSPPSSSKAAGAGGGGGSRAPHRPPRRSAGSRRRARAPRPPPHPSSQRPASSPRPRTAGSDPSSPLIARPPGK